MRIVAAAFALALVAAPYAAAQVSPNIVSIESPTPRDNGEFGAAVAGVPDVDGDGVDDFAVGAPGRVESMSSAGRRAG
jgi:hypothetical protein